MQFVVRHIARSTKHLCGGLLSLLILACLSVHGMGQEPQPQPSQDTPATVPGQFITLSAPLTDGQLSHVNQVLSRLKTEGDQQSKRPVLILQLSTGSSRMGQVRDLIDVLLSPEFSGVQTVAWLPQSVLGNHAAIALACHDIVMAADASMGDLSRGGRLPPADQEFFLGLADARRNTRLSRGIIESLLDTGVVLHRVKTGGPDGERIRFLTAAELRMLQQQQIEVLQADVMRDAGGATSYRADQAFSQGMLVTQLAQKRAEVAEQFRLPLESMREKPTGPANRARLIQIHGTIVTATRDFALREIRNARAAGVQTLIVEIDSPGGEKDIAEEITTALVEIDPAEMQTVAWIPKMALSGGGLIAMGCSTILMHPDAQVGDIGVIGLIEPGGAFERAPEKIVSPFLDFAATIARRRNRPPGLLQAMIDRNLEVYKATNVENGTVTWMTELEIQQAPDQWVQGPMVPETRPGVLLTLSGVRAAELGLSESPCEDMSNVRLRLGIAAEVALKPVGRTWVDGLVSSLNSRFGGFLLITLALLALYIEVQTWTGMFAIPSALCFTLFFWSRFAGGTAGMLELILFLSGLVLLGIEAYVIPGFGVFGVSGLVLFLGSLVMASQTFSGISASNAFDAALQGLFPIVSALVAVIVLATILNQFLPHIPWINGLILSPPGYAEHGDGPLLDPAVTVAADRDLLLSAGDQGVSMTTLRPSGKASFGDQYLDVVSDGPYIDSGCAVEVVRLQGRKVVVRRSAAEEPA